MPGRIQNNQTKNHQWHSYVAYLAYGVDNVRTSSAQRQSILPAYVPVRVETGARDRRFSKGESKIDMRIDRVRNNHGNAGAGHITRFGMGK